MHANIQKRLTVDIWKKLISQKFCWLTLAAYKLKWLHFVPPVAFKLDCTISHKCADIYKLRTCDVTAYIFQPMVGRPSQRKKKSTNGINDIDARQAIVYVMNDGDTVENGLNGENVSFVVARMYTSIIYTQCTSVMNIWEKRGERSAVLFHHGVKNCVMEIFLPTCIHVKEHGNVCGIFVWYSSVIYIQWRKWCVMSLDDIVCALI